jgi:quinolinate synthase
MKMNSLDALMAVLEQIKRPAALSAHAPRIYRELIGGRTVAQLGELPILHMREFQRSGHLPPALLVDMRSRAVS